MKRNFTTALILFFMIAHAAASTNYPVLRFGGMQGKVKSTVLTKYSVNMSSGRPGKGQLYSITISEYNPEGLIIRQELQDGEGNLLSATGYSYTGDKLSRIEIETTHGEEIFIQQLQSEANNEQVWIAGSSSDEQEPVSVIIRYDPEENSRSWYVHVSEEAVFDHKEVYDERGNIIIYQYGNDEMASIQTSTYDEDNNLVRQSHKTGKQEMVLLYSYPRYDHEGNWIEQLERNSTGFVISIATREIMYY